MGSYVLNVEYPYKSLKILTLGSFSSSPSIIYLCNNLFVLVQNHWYSFHTLGCNPLFYLFCSAQIVPVLGTASPFSWLLCPFTCLVLMCSLGILFYFLALQEVPGSSCIFLSPVLESNILQGDLLDFIAEWSEANIGWCSYCYEEVLLLILPSWGGKVVHVYMNLCIYAYL